MIEDYLIEKRGYSPPPSDKPVGEPPHCDTNVMPPRDEMGKASGKLLGQLFGLRRDKSSRPRQPVYPRCVPVEPLLPYMRKHKESREHEQ